MLNWSVVVSLRRLLNAARPRGGAQRVRSVTWPELTSGSACGAGMRGTPLVPSPSMLCGPQCGILLPEVVRTSGGYLETHPGWRTESSRGSHVQRRLGWSSVRNFYQVPGYETACAVQRWSTLGRVGAVHRIVLAGGTVRIVRKAYKYKP